MKYDICPICESPAQIHGNGSDHGIYSDYDIECFRCGKFNLVMWEHVYNIDDFKRLKIITDLNPNQIVNISGWIRENQGNKIVLDDIKIKSLSKLRNLNVFEKADKILLYLSKKYPDAGIQFDFKFNDINSLLINIHQGKYREEIGDINRKFLQNFGSKILRLVAISRAVDYREFSFIWSSYLRIEKQLITENNTFITPKGWAHIETLKQANPNSKKAFVAMWFDDSMFNIYDKFISRAIENAGFIPKHIGLKEHNNNINDEIIGEIRSSRFIVADFTGNRGGVYYKAGFANGLNIPVIHMCKREELNKVHFDVNHRNIIDWKTGEELYERLLNRIKATIV